VSRAAAQVRDRRARFGLLDDAGEQGPVERLAGQLVTEAGRVVLGNLVVAPAGGVVARAVQAGLQ
jgi:hypothetical protein